jgi:hypothetical protein
MTASPVLGRIAAPVRSDQVFHPVAVKIGHRD